MVDKAFEVKNGLVVNSAFVVDPGVVINATVNASFGNSTVNVNIDVVTARIGIKTATPNVAIDARADTGGIALPVGNTGQRPTSANGILRYNSETGGFEGYAAGAWGNVGGSGSSDQPGDIRYAGRDLSSNGYLDMVRDRILAKASYSNLFAAVGQMFTPGYQTSIGTKSPVDRETALNQVGARWLNGRHFLGGTKGTTNSAILVSNNFLDYIYTATGVLGDQDNQLISGFAYGNNTVVASQRCAPSAGTTSLPFAFFSTDNGNTWSNSTTSIGSGAAGKDGKAIAYGNGRFIIVGTREDLGANAAVYVSTDNGANWTNVDSGKAIFGSGGWDIVVYDGMGTFYAAASNVQSNSTVGGIYKSTDHGTTWSMAFNPANVAAQAANTFFVHGMGVGTNGQVVAIGVSNTFPTVVRCFSANQGGAWTVISNVYTHGASANTGHGIGGRHVEYIAANSTFIFNSHATAGGIGCTRNLGNNGFNTTTWFVSHTLFSTGFWVEGIGYNSTQDLICTGTWSTAVSPKEMFIGRDSNLYWYVPTVPDTLDTTPTTNTFFRIIPVSNSTAITQYVCAAMNRRPANNTVDDQMILVANSLTGAAGTWGLQCGVGVNSDRANTTALLSLAHDGTSRFAMLIANSTTGGNQYAQVYYSNTLTSWAVATMPGTAPTGAARLIINTSSGAAMSDHNDYRIFWANANFIAMCRFEANSTSGANSAAILTGNGSSFAITRIAGNNYTIGLAYATGNDVAFYTGVTTPTTVGFNVSTNVVYTLDNGGTTNIFPLIGPLSWGNVTHMDCIAGSNGSTRVFLGGGFIGVSNSYSDTVYTQYITYDTLEHMGLPNTVTQSAGPVLRLYDSWVLPTSVPYVSKDGMGWTLTGTVGFDDTPANPANGNFIAYLVANNTTMVKVSAYGGANGDHSAVASYYDPTTNFFLRHVSPLNEWVKTWVKT